MTIENREYKMRDFIKIPFFISPRLASLRILFDRILVMKDSRLVEQWAHADLLVAGEEYARLYKSQGQWYK